METVPNVFPFFLFLSYLLSAIFSRLQLYLLVQVGVNWVSLLFACFRLYCAYYRHFNYFHYFQLFLVVVVYTYIKQFKLFYPPDIVLLCKFYFICLVVWTQLTNRQTYRDRQSVSLADKQTVRQKNRQTEKRKSRHFLSNVEIIESLCTMLEGNIHQELNEL